MTSPRGDRRGSDLPVLGRPATRALAAAGIACLGDLTGWRRDDVLALHGVGPRAVGILDEALRSRGLTWSGGTAQETGTQQTP